MNLYIFEDVLFDYTGGMVAIAAYSVEGALEIAREKYGDYCLENEEGWRKPTAVYAVGPGVEAGIRHECWGGS